MAIVIEHEKRKREILDKSLDIFVEEGFEDATFQKIADRCGITRTTLYVYFKDKREIFLGSIKQLTSTVEAKLLNIVLNSSLSTGDKLRTIMAEIIDNCLENRKLFLVVLSYLTLLQKTGADPAEKVRRRVIRVRHLLSSLIIQGIKTGELRPVNVKAADELLYSLVEAAIFRLAVLDKKQVAEIRGAMNLAVDCLLAR
jgi:AcrR family transcriptional regulator